MKEFVKYCTGYLSNVLCVSLITPTEKISKKYRKLLIKLMLVCIQGRLLYCNPPPDVDVDAFQPTTAPCNAVKRKAALDNVRHFSSPPPLLTTVIQLGLGNLTISCQQSLQYIQGLFTVTCILQNLNSV